MLTPTATGTHDAHLSTHTKYSTWNIHPGVFGANVVSAD